MDEIKFEEILRLLDLQKQALTELALELVTPAPLRDGHRAGMSAQKAIIFRAKIEQQVRRLSSTEA
jgi:hypothetical protein